MKPVLLIVSTISKAQAKRLMFLFDRFETQKSWAGRKQGKHKIEDMIEPYADRHSFGRSIRYAPTTNGVTYQLEWSNACSRIHDNAPVCVNIFRLKENHLLIRVAPHKTLKIDARGYNTEEFEQKSYEQFCIDLRPKCVRIEFGRRSFVILRNHITEQAWAVWSNDWWKFDQVIEVISGQLNCIHDNRERFK